MLPVVVSISSLLLGIGILLTGMGLLGTLLGVRAGLEHFPDAVTGLIMSAYFLGYVLGTYICPTLIRRAGHIRAFAAMAAVASATAVVHALSVNPLSWGALRVVSGVCVVGLFMVVESWLNTLAPRQHRGRVFSLYVAVTLLAMALGQFLILAGDVGGFSTFGLVSVLLSLALVPVALTGVSEPVRVEAPRLGLRNLYRTSPLGVAGVLAAGLGSSAFWGMAALFGQRIGLSGNGIAAFMSATIIGGALLQWPIGHFSDHRDRRRVLVAVCFAATGFALLTLAASLGRSNTVLILCAFVYGGLSFSLYGLSVAHLNDYLAADEMLDATRGLLLVFGAGATAGPALAGLLMHAFGPRALLAYFATVTATLGLFGLYRMSRRDSVPVEVQDPFVPMLRTSQAALEMDPRVPEEVTNHGGHGENQEVEASRTFTPTVPPPHLVPAQCVQILPEPPQDEVA